MDVTYIEYIRDNLRRYLYYAAGWRGEISGTNTYLRTFCMFLLHCISFVRSIPDVVIVF
jgi:hypothetical protein